MNVSLSWASKGPLVFNFAVYTFHSRPWLNVERAREMWSDLYAGFKSIIYHRSEFLMTHAIFYVLMSRCLFLWIILWIGQYGSVVPPVTRGYTRSTATDLWDLPDLVVSVQREGSCASKLFDRLDLSWKEQKTTEAEARSLCCPAGQLPTTQCGPSCSLKRIFLIEIWRAPSFQNHPQRAQKKIFKTHIFFKIKYIQR